MSAHDLARSLDESRSELERLLSTVDAAECRVVVRAQMMRDAWQGMATGIFEMEA